MSKVVKAVVGVVATVVGVVTGQPWLIQLGVTMLASTLGDVLRGGGSKRRNAASSTIQVGEVSRQAILGRAATAGSLVDAFNYGGKDGTDWEVLVIALADHRCDALEGFYVNDSYVNFAGDGAVAGYNGQLVVNWRSGTESQAVPALLTANSAGWTANDRGRGVAYVAVAYKADAADAKNPVWPGGRPRFRWVVRGLRCYDPRKDSTAGGSGAHRHNNPATWEWSENPIVARYNWVRGIHACDRVGQPEQLLIGRGLSTIAAPPANLFHRANLCDEVVGGAARYRVGGIIEAVEPFIEIENDIAAACGGTIVQPEGAVEIDPGEARAPIAHFTDDDLLVGSRVKWSDFLGTGDSGWINTVVALFTDPAQQWQERSAPVRRDVADVLADGGPREQQVRLSLVSWKAQAERVAEIVRRFGRLWGRAEVTLPPRFAFVEEGDWVTWQSARHFGGATRTFRVEAYGSDEKWHHRLVLRQISASVYSDTAPLDDGVVAVQQPAPPPIAAPGVGAWAAVAGAMNGDGLQLPALIVTGASDDPAARFVRIEHFKGIAAPGVGAVWTEEGLFGPDIVRREIPVAAGATYWVAVSYVVEGVSGARRVLGPVALPGNFVSLPGLGAGALAAKDEVGGKNVVRNSSFEYGAPARVDLADGGQAFIQVLTGAAPDGLKFARIAPVGGHGYYYSSNTFIATGTKAVLSAWVKDSGVLSSTLNGGWSDPSAPDVPCWFEICLRDESTGTNYAITAPPIAAPAASGWIRYSASVSGLVPGHVYIPQFRLNGFLGRRAVDVDAIQIEQGDVLTAFGLRSDEAQWDQVSNMPQNIGELTGMEGIRNNLLSLSTDGVLYGGGGGAVTLAGIDTPGVIGRTARLSPSTGRVDDPQAYNTQFILGPRNVTTLSPIYTVNATDVTVSLPAHSRKIAGPSGPVTLDYGAASGNVAFSSYWIAYIDDPSLAGIATPAVTFTSNPDDLLFPGRYQIASGVSPSSAGSGGGVGSGGGGGGGWDNCVACYAWVEVRTKPSLRPSFTLDGRTWVRAGDVIAGDHVRVLTDDCASTAWRVVDSNQLEPQPGVRIVAASGHAIDLSASTPITLRDGSTVLAPEAAAHLIPVDRDGQLAWEPCSVTPIGELTVAHISCSDGTYLAGNIPGQGIYSHNTYYKP